MPLVDASVLDAIDERAFRERAPFPWVNPEGVLHEDAFELLRASLPDVSLFTPVFGKARAHGQYPHDRYALEYRPDLPVPEIWHQLVRELRGPAYQAFLARLLGTSAIGLSFHWHYTPRGCSVSPHCDAVRKLGSQIFYFSTAEDWNGDWGGETLMLESTRRFSRRGAPDFDDFEHRYAAETLGNKSVLFARTPHSWHGVRELRCPEGAMRKVFIVVINRLGIQDRVRRRLAGATP